MPEFFVAGENGELYPLKDNQSIEDAVAGTPHSSDSLEKYYDPRTQSQGVRMNAEGFWNKAIQEFLIAYPSVHEADVRAAIQDAEFDNDPNLAQIANSNDLANGIHYLEKLYGASTPRGALDPHTQTYADGTGFKHILKMLEQGLKNKVKDIKPHIPRIVDVPVMGNPHQEGRPWIYSPSKDTIYIGSEGSDFNDLLETIKDYGYDNSHVYSGILWDDGFADHFNHDLDGRTWERIQDALDEIYDSRLRQWDDDDDENNKDDVASSGTYDYYMPGAGTGGGNTKWNDENEWWHKTFRSQLQQNFLDKWEEMKGRDNSFVENVAGGYDSGSESDKLQQKMRSKSRSWFTEREDLPHFRWSFELDGRLTVWPVENGYPDHYSMFGAHGYNDCSQGRIYLNDDGLEILTWPGRPRSWPKSDRKWQFQERARKAVLDWCVKNLEANPQEIYYTSGSYGDMVYQPGGKGHVMGDRSDNHIDYGMHHVQDWKEAEPPKEEEPVVDNAWTKQYGDKMPHEIEGYDKLDSHAQNQMWTDWADAHYGPDAKLYGDEDLNGPKTDSTNEADSLKDKILKDHGDESQTSTHGEPKKLIASRWFDHQVGKEIVLSTVDLRSMGLNPPFETLVMGGPYNGYEFRWKDKETALKWHDKIADALMHHKDLDELYKTKLHEGNSSRQGNAFMYVDHEIGLVKGSSHEDCFKTINEKYPGAIEKLNFVPGWMEKEGTKFLVELNEGDEELKKLAVAAIKRDTGTPEVVVV